MHMTISFSDHAHSGLGLGLATKATKLQYCVFMVKIIKKNIDCWLGNFSCVKIKHFVETPTLFPKGFCVVIIILLIILISDMAMRNQVNINIS